MEVKSWKRRGLLTVCASRAKDSVLVEWYLSRRRLRLAVKMAASSRKTQESKRLDKLDIASKRLRNESDFSRCPWKFGRNQIQGLSALPADGARPTYSKSRTRPSLRDLTRYSDNAFRIIASFQ